jgi:histidinol phosphatase-like PHP family hydrolase
MIYNFIESPEIEYKDQFIDYLIGKVSDKPVKPESISESQATMLQGIAVNQVAYFGFKNYA